MQAMQRTKLHSCSARSRGPRSIRFCVLACRMVLRTALGAVRLAQRRDATDLRQSYAAISRFATQQSRQLRSQAQTAALIPAKPHTLAIAQAQRRTLTSSARRWSEKKEDLSSSPIQPPAKPPEPASTHDIAHSPEWVRRLVKAMPHTSLKRPTRDECVRPLE